MSLTINPAGVAADTLYPSSHPHDYACCLFCHRRLDFDSVHPIQICGIPSAVEISWVWYLSDCGHFLDLVCAYHHMQVHINIPLGRHAQALRAAGQPILHAVWKVWECPAPGCCEVYTSVLLDCANGWTMENKVSLRPFCWGRRHQGPGWGVVPRGTLADLELSGITIRQLMTTNEFFAFGSHASNQICVDWERFRFIDVFLLSSTD